MAEDKITMEINEAFNYVLQEAGNSFTAIRKISWNGAAEKIDIRKYAVDASGKETPLKGVTLTDDGANELTEVLASNGYGDTKNIIDGIKSRNDFIPSLKKSISDKDKTEIDEEYDIGLSEVDADEDEEYDIRGDLDD